LRIAIGVLGSAVPNLAEPVLGKVRELGREIAANDCALLVGVSEGVPQEAVRGAKEAGGFTIGFSPASSLSDHVQNYGLPADNLDLIVFTGFGFKGRNVILVRTCDAVVIVSGRIVGTLHLNAGDSCFSSGHPLGWS